MSYARKSDLIERFGERELVQLTDRTRTPPTTVDDVVVDRALGDAASLIDGYLGKVYALPLATVPTNLTKIQADVARYYLHGKAADKDSAVTRAYGEAIAWLRDVAAGRIRLDDGAGDAPAPLPGGAGRVQAGRPVFTRDTLRGF